MNRKRKSRRTARATAPIEKEAQIEIALAEYSAREQEKNFAAQGILKGPAIAVTLLVGILAAGQGDAYPQVWLVLPVTILVLLMVEVDRQFSVLYHSMFIELIEERINTMAGTSLLQWARLGSSYHTVIGKWRICSSRSKSALFNLGCIVQNTYVALAIAAFFFSLYKAWNVGALHSELGFAIYALLQLAVFLILIFRVRGRKDAIQFLKEDLRARLFPELPKPTASRAPKATLFG